MGSNSIRSSNIMHVSHDYDRPRAALMTQIARVIASPLRPRPCHEYARPRGTLTATVVLMLLAQLRACSSRANHPRAPLQTAVALASRLRSHPSPDNDHAPLVTAIMLLPRRSPSCSAHSYNHALTRLRACSQDDVRAPLTTTLALLFPLRLCASHDYASAPLPITIVLLSRLRSPSGSSEDYDRPRAALMTKIALVPSRRRSAGCPPHDYDRPRAPLTTTIVLVPPSRPRSSSPPHRDYDRPRAALAPSIVRVLLSRLRSSSRPPHDYERPRAHLTTTIVLVPLSRLRPCSSQGAARRAERDAVITVLLAGAAALFAAPHTS